MGFFNRLVGWNTRLKQVFVGLVNLVSFSQLVVQLATVRQLFETEITSEIAKGWVLQTQAVAYPHAILVALIFIFRQRSLPPIDMDNDFEKKVV